MGIEDILHLNSFHYQNKTHKLRAVKEVGLKIVLFTDKAILVLYPSDASNIVPNVWREEPMEKGSVKQASIKDVKMCKWEEWENRAIRERYSNEGAAKLALDLNRSPEAIRYRAHLLKATKSMVDGINQGRWTLAEDAIMHAEYIKAKDVNKLANKLNRTVNSVIARASKLGLKRIRTKVK